MNFNVKEIIFKENTEVDEKEEIIKIIEHMSKIVINKSLFLFADILYKIYIILAGIFKRFLKIKHPKVGNTLLYSYTIKSINQNQSLQLTTNKNASYTVNT